MFDASYKLLRKHIPSSVYTKLQEEIGRKKYYYSLQHFAKIVDLYKDSLSLENKIVVEFGPGNEIATAVLMILNGARKVFLIDRINIFTSHYSRNDIHYVDQLKNDYLNANYQLKDYLSVMDSNEILSRIHRVNSYLNKNAIIKIPRNSCDYVVSHEVLEHVTDVSLVFECVKYLLKPNGYFFSKIDLSDHSYHVFSKYRFLAFLRDKYKFRHLSYSDKNWELLNDHKNIYMNRELLPKYLYYFSKYEFDIVSLELIEHDCECTIHRDVISDIPEKYLQTKNIKNIEGFSFLVKSIC
ncbi:methyltransferase domain-containing protein [Thermodesulfobacteriota bacterium]